jgi:MOSC domain-containing protein YiiM
MAVGTIDGIYIATQNGDLIQGHNKVAVKAGKGIVGDRYYSETGNNRSNYKGEPDWEITLIEAEVVEAFNRSEGHQFHVSDFRRNLVTRDVELNNLVGKRFSISGTLFYGVQLCEPCASLQQRLGVSILPELVGKGGLRAQILSNGVVSVGDSLE